MNFERVLLSCFSFPVQNNPIVFYREEILLQYIVTAGKRLHLLLTD